MTNAPALRSLLIGSALVGSVLVGSFLVGSVVEAQELQLRLVSQSAYAASDGNFVVELAWNGPVDDTLSVGVTVFGQATTEEELGAREGGVLNRWPGGTPLLLTQLGRSPEGNLLVGLPIRSSSPGDPARLWIPDPGVYPIVVEVRGPEGPIASVATELIRLPADLSGIDRLELSLLLTVGPDDGLPIAEAIALLEAHPSTTLTVLLDEGVYDQLLATPDEAERLTAALGGRPVLMAPRLDLDPSALAEIGQGSLYQPALDQTASELRAIGMTPAQALVSFDGPLTESGAQLLVDLGLASVVDTSGSNGRGGRLSTGKGRLAVVVPDIELTDELRDDAFAVSRTHRLLALLAIRQKSDDTPVVIGGSETGPLSAAGLAVLLEAFDGDGLVEAVPLSERVAPRTAVRADERPAQDLLPLSDNVTRVLSELDTFRTFYVAGGTSPDALRYEVVAALARDLDPDSRSEALARVQAGLDVSFGAVSLPEFQSVTLAAQQSLIPMAIHNGASGGRNVLLRFESDKIEVPANGTVVEIAPGASSLDIEVETRSVGLSPLDVIVLTPDGRLELARARFQVRSTAVPGLGLLLSGVGLGLLALWWGKSILRDRRQRVGECA